MTPARASGPFSRAQHPRSSHPAAGPPLLPTLPALALGGRDRRAQGLKASLPSAYRPVADSCSARGCEPGDARHRCALSVWGLGAAQAPRLPILTRDRVPKNPSKDHLLSEAFGHAPPWYPIPRSSGFPAGPPRASASPGLLRRGRRRRNARGECSRTLTPFGAARVCPDARGGPADRHHPPRLLEVSHDRSLVLAHRPAPGG